MEGKRKRNHKSIAAFWPELGPELAGRLGRQRAALGHPSSFTGMSQAKDSKSPALLILEVSLASRAASSLVKSQGVSTEMSLTSVLSPLPLCWPRSPSGLSKPSPHLQACLPQLPSALPCSKGPTVASRTFCGHRTMNRQGTLGPLLARHSQASRTGQ